MFRKSRQLSSILPTLLRNRRVALGSSRGDFWYLRETWHVMHDASSEKSLSLGNESNRHAFTPCIASRAISTSRHFHSGNIVNVNTHTHPFGKSRHETQHKNSYFRRGSKPMTPKDMIALEKTTKQHLGCFQYDFAKGIGSMAISSWQRTAVSLLLEWSKLWGRNRHEQSASQEQLFQGVSLAHELAMNILTIEEKELDNYFDSAGVKTDSPELLKNHNNFVTKLDEGENINVESICRVVALGWSRCDGSVAKDAANKANDLLIKLEEIAHKRQIIPSEQKVSFQLLEVAPTPSFYNHVLSCWSRSTDSNAETQAVTLLERMSLPLETYARPDVFSYNNLLNLHANRGDVDKAEALLKEMEESGHRISPDAYSYTIVMNAFQKRFTTRGSERDINDPSKAEEILSRLVKKFEESNYSDINLRPTHVTFGTVLSMYAAADRLLKEDMSRGDVTRKWWSRNILSGANDQKMGWGAENAERILEWMIASKEKGRRKIVENKDKATVNNRGDDLILVTNRHFLTVIDAWAKAGKGVMGAKRCEHLIERLENLYQSSGGDPKLRPGPKHFGAVIDAYARADEQESTAEHAEIFLDKLEDLFLHSTNPNEALSNIVYNLVIDAWSRRIGPNSGVRANRVLRRMVENYNKTKNPSLRPDVISYTGVMKAYVNHPNGGEEALKILHEMKEQFNSGNANAKPDFKAYAVAIDACVRSGLLREAESLLDELDDSAKNQTVFNTVMNGYRMEGRGQEAESVLKRMIELEDRGYRRCSPNSVSFGVCMEAWGRSKSKSKVHACNELFKQCVSRYQSGDNTCKPNLLHFHALAGAITSIGSQDRVSQVLSLFEKMEEQGIKPNRVTFNILIKTCASVFENEDAKINALQVAISAFSSLESIGISADSITYTSMVNVIKHLVDDPDEKFNALQGLFLRSCEQGFLNQHIINVLAECTSADQFQAITGMSSVETVPGVDTFPSEWSANATVDHNAQARQNLANSSN
ncbi:hypothetical protein ACHAXS_010558 [Conticribra weissflogii]